MNQEAKRLLDQRFNSIDTQRRFSMYEVFLYYYKGLLLEEEKVSQAIDIIEEYIVFYSNLSLELGLEMLKSSCNDSIADAIYDYNRLFVGPGKLLAPPYESKYRNHQGLLMQRETINVRRFYEKVGVSVSEEICEPDDHLAFELELVCYLLSQSVKEEKKYRELYNDFFSQHLEKWIFNHCEDVIAKSTSRTCKSLGLILKEFMLLEQKQMPKGGKSVEQAI